MNQVKFPLFSASKNVTISPSSLISYDDPDKLCYDNKHIFIRLAAVVVDTYGYITQPLL